MEVELSAQQGDVWMGQVADGAVSTLVVMPTYNEVGNVDVIVDRVLEQSPEIHLLIVDDNSPDGTGVRADDLALRIPRLAVLHRRLKQGLGPAYVAGLLHGLASGFDRFVTMDADLSHDPVDLPRLLATLDDGADVAIGSRWVKGGGTVGWPLSRRLLSRGGSTYARLMLGVPLRDVTGGYKCFRREALSAIDPGGMRSTGYAFNIELNLRATRLGLRMVEVPITFRERRVGESKMSRQIILEALRTVPQMRRDLPLAHRAPVATDGRPKGLGSGAVVSSAPLGK